MSNLLYDKVLEADVLIFATPVNNFKMSSLMSLFIDRLISLDGSLLPADPLASKDKELNTLHTKWISENADSSFVGSGFLKRFSGKVAGIIVTGHEEGASMVVSSLFLTLNHFGMIFPPWSFMYAIGNVLSPTNEDKKIQNNNFFVNEAKDLSKNLHTMAKLVGKEKKSIWLCETSIN
jgi:multimeric flavodoxin WrbA